MSRLLNENTAWKLDPSIFQKILKLFSVKPETDMFPSHLNFQVPTYAPLNPEKNVYGLDAFSISWVNLKFYDFPPINVIGASVSKIRRNMIAGISNIQKLVTVLVFHDDTSFSRFPSSTSSKSFDKAIQQGTKKSLLSENETAGSTFIVKAFRIKELPSEVNKVSLESW